MTFEIMVLGALSAELPQNLFATSAMPHRKCIAALVQFIIQVLESALDDQPRAVLGRFLHDKSTPAF